MPFDPIPYTTEDFFNYLVENFGPEVSVPNLLAASDHFGCSLATVKKRMKQYKTGYNKWQLTVAEARKQFEAAVAPQVSLVPAADPNYVPFGNYSTIKKVIKSKAFYPTYIQGLSGNGKTLGVEQACASLNRELIRVNITIETDEDDLIGGFRLVDGNTVWHNGPVIDALEKGTVLLLDEVDLASNKILCLQSVLEGKGVFLKKIGRYVKPSPGFNVIATANTKGKGSDDGRFVGTNILNEAFLERFPLTVEQEYPTAAVETKILLNTGIPEDFAENLVKWAGVIRKTFYDGGVDEVVTTRRLVHISQAYQIFNDRLRAITGCVSRFDEDTKQSFLDLYTKVDAGEDSEYNDGEETISS